jgi:pentatricopeptide repeat protein
MESSFGVSPDLLTYNFALNACALGGDSSAALNILARMSEGGRVRPDVVTLNSVINACATEGKENEALGLLTSMKQQHGVEPDTTSFNAAIRAFEKEGHWRKASYLILLMEASGVEPDVATFTSVIKSCAKAGAWEKALYSFNLLKERAIPLDEYAVNSVLKALESANGEAEAIAIMQEARRIGLYSTAWASPSQVDLHRLSTAVSRAIMRIIFIELESGARKIGDLKIITGRGNHSDGGNAILQQDMLNFISTYQGPKITKSRNPGAFLLSAGNIRTWLGSRADIQR